MSAAKNAVTAFEIKRALAEKHYKDFFITECKSGPTQIAAAGTLKILDGLAIKKSWTAPCFTGYEIKVSRSDFLRDAKFYTYEEICNCLYIVCPKGMIDRTELPESIGLMYYDPEKKTITTRKRAIYRKIEYTPELLLYIIFSRLDSDRIPFFSDRRAYFEAYAAGKTENRDLARAVNSRIVADNARMERELEEVAEAIRAALVRIFGDAADQFQALNDAMNALAQGEELEPITPDIAEKAPRPHPCPASGKLRPPKSTRTAYAARVQRIRPQARSTIRQRRNRRRE